MPVLLLYRGQPRLSDLLTPDWLCFWLTLLKRQFWRGFCSIRQTLCRYSHACNSGECLLLPKARTKLDAESPLPIMKPPTDFRLPLE